MHRTQHTRRVILDYEAIKTFREQVQRERAIADLSAVYFKDTTPVSALIAIAHYLRKIDP